jgi:hypothetical protein
MGRSDVKKIVRRKTRRRPAGLTRLQIAERLGVSRVSIERLVAAGRLRPIGRRGCAHTYDPASVRRLARDLVPVTPDAVDIALHDYHTHALDFADRRRALVETWIADDVWRPAWESAIAWTAHHAAIWPEQLVERLGAAEPADVPWLRSGDGPRPSGRYPRRYLLPAAVQALLDDPAGPFKPAARPLVRDTLGRGHGVELIDYPDGSHGWHPWDPSQGEPVERPPAEPIIRPLLQELVEAIPLSDEWIRLDAALTVPAPEPAPDPPADVDAARQAWRAARSAYRSTRVAVRRGHHRRQHVVDAIEHAIASAKAVIWSQGRGHVVGAAGRPGEIRERAARMTAEALGALQAIEIGGAR